MKKQVVRQIDETGRIVLPKPFREMLGLSIKDDVVITMENDAIILRKYADSCMFCGNEYTYKYCGMCICEDCYKKIGEMK